MRAEHLEFLVEEPSAEAFLMGVLPKILGEQVTFGIHLHQGKGDLLKRLKGRLRGYARFLQPNARVVVLVDRDATDCRVLKARLEADAADAQLSTRASAGNADWRVVTRLAIEELEAWYFGDWASVRSAYPRVASNIPDRERYRDCDAIQGGTAEALERELVKSGHLMGGLRKVETARAIASAFDPGRCASPSFAHFRTALLEAIRPAPA